jgi:sensor domain CHASE-containing protein
MKKGEIIMNVDLKTIATFIGIAASLAGIVGTWTLMQYRLDQLEQQQSDLQRELEIVHQSVEKAGLDVKCLICDAHDIPCPGC